LTTNRLATSTNRRGRAWFFLVVARFWPAALTSLCKVRLRRYLILDVVCIGGTTCEMDLWAGPRVKHGGRRTGTAITSPVHGHHGSRPNTPRFAMDASGQQLTVRVSSQRAVGDSGGKAAAPPAQRRCGFRARNSHGQTVCRFALFGCGSSWSHLSSLCDKAAGAVLATEGRCARSHFRNFDGKFMFAKVRGSQLFGFVDEAGESQRSAWPSAAPGTTFHDHLSEGHFDQGTWRARVGVDAGELCKNGAFARQFKKKHDARRNTSGPGAAAFEQPSELGAIACGVNETRPGWTKPDDECQHRQFGRYRNIIARAKNRRVRRSTTLKAKDQ